MQKLQVCTTFPNAFAIHEKLSALQMGFPTRLAATRMSKPTGRAENRALTEIIFLVQTEGSHWITSTTCTRLMGTVSNPVLDTSMASPC